MKELSRHIPNLLTSLNLFSGCVALVFVFQGNIPVFTALIGASLFFDFLDGFAARMLKAGSPFGKELDSLADVVSFGLVPGAIMYHLFLDSVPLTLMLDQPWTKFVAFFPFIITVFSALRLAKFNLDTRQTDSFIGLPTPAATIFITGIAYVLYDDRLSLTPVVLNSYFIAGLSMVISYLLVAEIPLMALKFKSFGWKENSDQYLLILASVVFVYKMGVPGVSLSIILYLILSLLSHYSKKNKKPESIP